MTRSEILQWLSELATAQRGGADKLRAAPIKPCMLECVPVWVNSAAVETKALREGQAQGLEIAAQTLEDFVARETSQ